MINRHARLLPIDIDSTFCAKAVPSQVKQGDQAVLPIGPLGFKAVYHVFTSWLACRSKLSSIEDQSDAVAYQALSSTDRGELKKV